MTIGSRIHKARKQAGKTQQLVADHFGISRAAVSQWEADDTTPGTKKLKQLAAFLNVPPQWLVFGDSAEEGGVSDKQSYNKEFVSRTRQARKHAGMTCAEVATVFGIREQAYIKYENRTPLPHYLLERFCILVRCDVEWLVMGRGRRYT
ncbi:MAG: helix-turn-helix domain-containing protein, partial [Planctomycetes bacterium]|nr:helix-turn-helix domain-containing protein [Planctomycetota bacterium]